MHDNQSMRRPVLLIPLIVWLGNSLHDKTCLLYFLKRSCWSKLVIRICTTRSHCNKVVDLIIKHQRHSIPLKYIGYLSIAGLGEFNEMRWIHSTLLWISSTPSPIVRVFKYLHSWNTHAIMTFTNGALMTFLNIQWCTFIFQSMTREAGSKRGGTISTSG